MPDPESQTHPIHIDTRIEVQDRSGSATLEGAFQERQIVSELDSYL